MNRQNFSRNKSTLQLLIQSLIKGFLNTIYYAVVLWRQIASMMDALRPETEVHYSPKFNWHPRDVDIFNIDESGNVDDINNRDMRVMLIIPVVMLMITTKTMCWQFQLSEWWWHLDTVDIFNNQSDVDKQAMLTFSILAFPIRIRGLLQFSNEIRIILSLGAYLQIRLCNQGI